jgi:hypothetical protein
MNDASSLDSKSVLPRLAVLLWHVKLSGVSSIVSRIHLRFDSKINRDLRSVRERDMDFTSVGRFIIHAQTFNGLTALREAQDMGGSRYTFQR